MMDPWETNQQGPTVAAAASRLALALVAGTELAPPAAASRAVDLRGCISI